jgi:transcriptional regulator with GAF, ATPase, and Fis domain
MNERGFVTVSMRELERIKIFAAVAEHRLKVVQAAERLDLCERQVSRLVRRYETSGSDETNADRPATMPDSQSIRVP